MNATHGSHSVQRFLEKWGVVVAFVLLFAASFGSKASTF